MKPVSNTPPLPYPSNAYNVSSLGQFDQDLTKALYAYLGELARRANAGLPMDGSEVMTGDFNMGGFDITNVGNVHAYIGELGLAAPDLNDYIETGLYHEDQNVHATAGSNFPVALAGLLTVTYVNESFVYQTYQAYNNTGFYTRSRYNGTWNAWVSR